MLDKLLRGGFLEGRKTYLLGALMALQGLVAWAIGDAPLSQELPNILEGLSLMTLRAGIARSLNPDNHRERLRELVAELIAKAQAEDPNLPPIDPDRVLAALESRGPKP